MPLGIAGRQHESNFTLAGMISSYSIWEACQLGAPRWLIERMVTDRLDTTLGALLARDAGRIQKSRKGKTRSEPGLLRWRVHSSAGDSRCEVGALAQDVTQT